jgi:hypothetical protein
MQRGILAVAKPVNAAKSYISRRMTAGYFDLRQRLDFAALSIVRL